MSVLKYYKDTGLLDSWSINRDDLCSGLTKVCFYGDVDRLKEYMSIFSLTITDLKAIHNCGKQYITIALENSLNSKNIPLLRYLLSITNKDNLELNQLFIEALHASSIPPFVGYSWLTV